MCLFQVMIVWTAEGQKQNVPVFCSTPRTKSGEPSAMQETHHQGARECVCDGMCGVSAANCLQRLHVGQMWRSCSKADMKRLQVA